VKGPDAMVGGKLLFMRFVPSDWLADPLVRGLSPAARGCWIDWLSAIHELAPDSGSVTRQLSWFASIVGLRPDEALAYMREMQSSGTADITPDLFTGLVASETTITIVSRRMVRDAALRHRKREEKVRNRGLSCESHPQVPLSPRKRGDIAATSRRQVDRKTSADASSPSGNGVVATMSPRCRHAVASLSPAEAPEAPEKDSHPSGSVGRFPRASPTPNGGSLVRRGPGPEQAKHSPAARPTIRPSRANATPAARRVAPPDAERRAPSSMRDLLAALVPTLAPASTGMGLRETTRRPDDGTVATAAAAGTRQDAPYAIRDPIALAVRAWRSGKSVGAGTWGLHVALRAAAHAIREGREQLRLFWHLLAQPLAAWCRAIDDDTATAWMRQVRVRTC
jgi:hypothetical protein